MGDEVIFQRFSVRIEQWIVPQKTKNSQAASRLERVGRPSKPQLYSFGDLLKVARNHNI
jgi:hypothetical protein